MSNERFKGDDLMRKQSGKSFGSVTDDDEEDCDVEDLPEDLDVEAYDLEPEDADEGPFSNALLINKRNTCLLVCTGRIFNGFLPSVF